MQTLFLHMKNPLKRVPKFVTSSHADVCWGIDITNLISLETQVDFLATDERLIDTETALNKRVLFKTINKLVYKTSINIWFPQIL